MAKNGVQEPAIVTLDPYQCIAKRNRKYASECTEVHLSNLGAEEISENFRDFENLETLWLSNNRLSRIENLDVNFRIREVYLADNRLVSLSGLKTFKFLRILLASNNQLRNLEKQLAVLTRFAFLKKLDLFDNPVAEEPDYRLRIIYHVPQVEALDRHGVKGPERLRADEVVPNLDRVSAAKPEKAKRKPPWADHSVLEQSCFRAAKEIKERRKREDDAALGQTFARSLDLAVAPPIPRTIRENRDRWELSRTLPREDSLGGFGLHSRAGDVLKVCADVVQKPEPFHMSLKRHLSGPAAKPRGDVFHQTFLLAHRAADDSGKIAVKVRHDTKLTPIGG